MQNKHKLMLAMGTVLLAAFCFIAVGALDDSSSDSNVTLSAENTAPVASIGDTTYNTLEEALNAAVSGQTVVLISDYTMTSNATVKAGVFLLLPCMDNDVGYASTGFNPDGTSSSTADLSVLYRTLNIPSNVTLTVEGDVMVNAVTGRPAAGNYLMDITGGYAQINLEGSILVKNGGLLDNYGYIKGDGQVTAESGAEIRDLYVVVHWRGGSQVANILGAGAIFGIYKDCYPITEYNCHNIESKIVIYSGASFTGNVKMYGNSSYNYTRYPQIDNNNGLIRLSADAYLVKTFNPSAVNGTDSDKGRVTMDIYGGAVAGSSTLTLDLGSYGNKTLTTSKFTYPVDGDITIGLHNGTYTFNNSFKFLTGAEVIVYEDASVAVPSGKKVVFYSEFTDVDNTSTTEYPQRPAAAILLKGNSTLNIQGTFAGIVKCETSENQVITASGSTTTGVTTNEANGYKNGLRTLTFNMDIQVLAA